MKIVDLARPRWGTLALSTLAGTAIGFAAGFVVGRDPAAARRAFGQATQWAAIGFEQATLWAAQLREQVGDLWAESREASLSAVDAADFERQAASAAARRAASGSTTAQPSARTGAAATSQQRPKRGIESKAPAKPRTDTKVGAKARTGAARR